MVINEYQSSGCVCMFSVLWYALHPSKNRIFCALCLSLTHVRTHTHARWLWPLIRRFCRLSLGLGHSLWAQFILFHSLISFCFIVNIYSYCAWVWACVCLTSEWEVSKKSERNKRKLHENQEDNGNDDDKAKNKKKKK